MILYLFGWIAVHPPIRPVTLRDQVDAQAAAHAASEGFGNVSLTTADGTILKAWLLSPPSPNGGAVILLHGVLDNRLGVYGYGKWLLKNHYAVFLPDARGHGLSGGSASTDCRSLLTFTRGWTG